MIKKIKKIEAMLELLKREYKQNIKGSTPDTPMIILPPPRSVTTIPYGKPVREVKSGNRSVRQREFITMMTNQILNKVLIPRKLHEQSRNSRRIATMVIMEWEMVHH